MKTAEEIKYDERVKKNFDDILKSKNEYIVKLETETRLALEAVRSLELQKKNLEKALAESEKTIVNLKLSLETEKMVNTHANECIKKLTINK